MSSSALKTIRVCVVGALAFVGAAVPLGVAGATGSSSRAVTDSAASLALRATAVSAAQAGAGWIARDLSASGALVDAETHLPSAGDTTDAVLALVAAGVGANQVKAATSWLEHNFASYVSSKGIDSAGRLGLLILATVAAGADPYHFGGKTHANDLVARLEATEQVTGASAGAFGIGPDVNAFDQSLALLALASVKSLGKQTKAAESYLASLQCTDGGWEYSRTSKITPCATPNPKNYSSPDTNTTALAVMATLATGGHFSDSPVTFFKDSQETNGSFGVYGVAGEGQSGDPDSTAYVIQALTALKVINSPQFVRSGTTPEQALARFQYGCKASVSERGEYSYFGAPSQLATLQAVPAAAEAAFPILPRKLSVAEPRLSCGAG